MTYYWLSSPVGLCQVDAARIVALHRYMTNPGAAVVVVLPIVNGQLPMVWIRGYHRFEQFVPITAWQAVERLKGAING